MVCLSRNEYGDLLVNFRIQSECRKIQTRKNFVFGHFPHSRDLRVSSHNKETNQLVCYANRLTDFHML